MIESHHISTRRINKKFFDKVERTDDQDYNHWDAFGGRYPVGLPVSGCAEFEQGEALDDTK